jgi:hypothetical protein
MYQRPTRPGRGQLRVLLTLAVAVASVAVIVWAVTVIRAKLDDETLKDLLPEELQPRSGKRHVPRPHPSRGTAGATTPATGTGPAPTTPTPP